MNLKDFQKFCLSFDGTSEDHPSEEKNLVAFNVMDKVFAVADEDDFDAINLRCDPVKASMLRNLYDDVQPGQHMDKRHWNSINPDGGLDDELIEEWIKDSYNLVVEDLPRKEQKKLEKMSEE